MTTPSLFDRIVSFLISEFAFDLFAAYALMRGIQGLHHPAGFWPCLLIIFAISAAVQSAP